LVARNGLQESAKASGAGAFTANSGNKTLIKNRLFIREARCFHLFPMRKTKSRAERHASYQKPALRSEAFARALSEAKLCVAGSGGLRSLFEQAARKVASVPKEPFKENWAYLQTMLRLVRAYERGEYRHVSNDALMWIVAGLNYLVDPFDLIPDKTPFLGFVDDATVVEFVADKSRQALDEFMIWETSSVANSG
jgi:uncharacterized membrane protein YkvA (DUF1232 family)